LGKEYKEKNRKINEQNIHFLKRNGPFSLKSLSRKKKKCMPVSTTEAEICQFN